MRLVADHLIEIADLLPPSQTSRRLLLLHNADRVRASAASLNSEVMASNPSTARRVAEVAGIVLLWVGAGTLPGVAEGISSTLTAATIDAHERAVICVTAVEQAAAAAEVSLASEVRASTNTIRLAIRNLYLRNVGTGRATPPEAETAIRHLGEADMDMPNARQRWVAMEDYLRWFIESRDRFETGPDDDDHLVRLQAQLQELREQIEVLAQTDESLYPPQPTGLPSE
jgi:hypothetical protein